LSSPDSLSLLEAFPHNWRVEVLANPPLIAPARQFTYPQQVAGEEDAMTRGALRLLVHPAAGPTFLATCALGFADPSMPTGVYPCPNPGELCALAGGYAYILDTAAPERCTHIPLRPVAGVLPIPAHNLLLFAGFHSLVAWGEDGLAWQTARLTWDGLTITTVDGNTLHGLGWNMPSDKDVPFTVDLRTGTHTGGGF
jgi:hypothetical protein